MVLREDPCDWNFLLKRKLKFFDGMFGKRSYKQDPTIRGSGVIQLFYHGLVQQCMLLDRRRYEVISMRDFTNQILLGFFIMVGDQYIDRRNKYFDLLLLKDKLFMG